MSSESNDGSNVDDTTPRLTIDTEQSRTPSRKARATGNVMNKTFSRFKPRKKTSKKKVKEMELGWTQRYSLPPDKEYHLYHKTLFDKPARARLASTHVYGAKPPPLRSEKPRVARKLAPLEDMWDGRAAVSASTVNDLKYAGQRQYFDRPLPFDDASPGIEPHLENGLAWGPRGIISISPTLVSPITLPKSTKPVTATARSVFVPQVAPAGRPATSSAPGRRRRPLSRSTDFQPPKAWLQLPAGRSLTPSGGYVDGTPPVVLSPTAATYNSKRSLSPALKVGTSPKDIEAEGAWDEKFHLAASKSNTKLNPRDREYFDNPRVLHADGRTSPTVGLV